jgi:hypothetical protein
VPGNAYTSAAAGYNRAPNEAEYSLLALANMARADKPLKPYVWNDDLALAARFHTWDMLTHDCFQHDSCNGELWAKRIGRYYPFGSTGENIGGGPPWLAHDAWMGSPGHRAAILGGFTEFGGGGMVDEFKTSDATEDFGYRNDVTIPAIPSGTVLEPRFWEGSENGSVWHWQLLVNFYDASGKTPANVKAFVDGAPVSLSRIAGTNANGTWSAFVNAPGYTQNPFGLPAPYCKRVHYEITRNDGQVFRYPQTDDIGLGRAPGCEFRAPHGSGGPVGPPPTGGAPTVTISSPANHATVSGTVTIQASATDDTKVKTVEIYIDGRRAITRHALPVTRKWNASARSVRPGTHTITVKAYDDQGNVGARTVTVTK